MIVTFLKYLFGGSLFLFFLIVQFQRGMDWVDVNYPPPQKSQTEQSMQSRQSRPTLVIDDGEDVYYSYNSPVSEHIG